MRADLLILSQIIFIVSNLLLAYLPFNILHGIILIPLLLSGLHYSTYSAIFWPCIPLVVDKNKVGTAFGVTVAFLNANLVISPLIFGVIHDKTMSERNGYFWPILFIGLQTIIGIYASGLLSIIDYKSSKVLDSKIEENREM